MARSTRAAKKSASAQSTDESPQEVADAVTPLQNEELAASLSIGPPLTHVSTVFSGHLTDEIRAAIIQKHQDEPDLSQVQLTDWLERVYNIKVNRTTIGRTLQRIRSPNSKQKSVKKGTSASAAKTKKLDLDQAVYDWYLDKANAVDPANKNGTESVIAFGVHTFREKAHELAQTGLYHVPPKATFTDSWLKSFLSRFNLVVTALPINEDGTVGGDESDAAAANITGGSGNGGGGGGGSGSGSEAGKTAASWPNDLLPYLAPTDGQGETEEGSEDEEEGKGKQQSGSPRRVVRMSSDGVRRHSRWTSAQHVTEEMREALLKKREEEPSISQHQLAGWLNATYGVRVHRATIGRNIKRILNESAGDVGDGESEPVTRKSAKIQTEKEMDKELTATAPAAFEQALLDWWTLQKKAGEVPTDKEFLEKARQLKKQPDLDVPASFALTVSWRNSFKRRHNLDDKPDVEVDVACTVQRGASPSMVEVHTSVNLIRNYVFNSGFDQETKKELMQGLDDIYIKLGDANRKSQSVKNDA